MRRRSCCSSSAARACCCFLAAASRFLRSLSFLRDSHCWFGEGKGERER